ncbi:Alcohol O-acetyltransferase [Mortierella sp. GBA39]|nr:Alcohol O-acetyltransferase [Mortierella sp. GBA39]
MMDDMAIPMPQMSPGLSPSSSSSASPSPPIASPPPSNFSLDQYRPSMTIPPHATNSHTYEHNPHHSEQSPRDLSPVSSSDSYSYSYHTHESRHQAPQQPKDNRFVDNTLIRDSHSQQRVHYQNQSQSQNQSQVHPEDREDEENGDDEHELDMMTGDSGVDDAMFALQMRRQSHASTMNSSEPSPSSSSSLSPIDRDLQPSTLESGVTVKSKKVVQATSRKTGPRKRSHGQDESPEAKRQKFLERNRMAASRCREKKRLQTLKTISDADEITARNQTLHETLDELQEEVRRLKNQILCHRDCSCDVIQKFVHSSFGTTNSSISRMSDSNPSAFTSTMHVFQDMIPVHSMEC